MDRFNALGRGAQIMLVGAVLLLIDSFFDWQAIEDFPGVSAWDNFLGILMGLLTLALIAWLVVRLLGVDFKLPVSAAMLSAILGGLILLFAVLKNLTDDYSTFASYLGVVLAAVIAFGAWLEVQEAGGIDSLKGEMSTVTSSDSSAASTPPPPAATPEPSAPAPEAAPPPVEPTPSAEPARPSAEPEAPSDAEDRRDV